MESRKNNAMELVEQAKSNITELAKSDPELGNIKL